MSGITQDLDSYMKKWRDKIEHNDFGKTYTTGDWQKDAFEMTSREIPRIAATGHEVGDEPVGSALGSTLRRGDPALATRGPVVPKRWETELEVRLRLRGENPVLRRTKVLKAASGRYSVDAVVCNKSTVMRPLPLLTHATFAATVAAAPANQLVVVVCLRDDDQLCVRIGQLMEVVHGKLYQGKLPAPFECQAALGKKAGRGGGHGELDAAAEAALPARLYKFAMTESRYVVREFGVHSIPAYLMFVGGKLVRARSMGARAVRLQQDRTLPRVLLVEPGFKHQVACERWLRRLGYQWELAMTAAQGEGYAQRRAAEGSACPLVWTPQKDACPLSLRGGHPPFNLRNSFNQSMINYDNHQMTRRSGS